MRTCRRRHIKANNTRWHRKKAIERIQGVKAPRVKIVRDTFCIRYPECAKQRAGRDSHDVSSPPLGDPAQIDKNARCRKTHRMSPELITNSFAVISLERMRIRTVLIGMVSPAMAARGARCAMARLATCFITSDVLPLKTSLSTTHLQGDGPWRRRE